MSGDTITGISPGTATITLKAADGSETQQSFDVTVDKYYLLLNSCSSYELNYLYSPLSELCKHGISLEGRLEYISIFRQYPNESDIPQMCEDYPALKSNGTWLNTYLWNEYQLARVDFFNPKNNKALWDTYYDGLSIFIQLVTFDIAKRLNPFDEYGNLKSSTVAQVQAELADAMTNNPESENVLLGSSYGDNKYFEVARQKKWTYFYSEYYDNYVSDYGQEYMRNVNKKFLLKQAEAGKTFYFSSDPEAPWKNSGFEMEVNWLKNYYPGCSFVEEEKNNLWRLKIPK